MTEPRRRRGRAPSISDDEIQKLLDEGLNQSEIARWFTERGRSITAQAISLRVKRIREDQKENYILPWAVRTVHSTGFVFHAVVAYAKWRRGEALTDRQKTELRQLEQKLHELDAVITYDYHQGFVLRNRRPDDGPNLLVKR